MPRTNQKSRLQSSPAKFYRILLNFSASNILSYFFAGAYINTSKNSIYFDEVTLDLR
jgi:hypothetical protein